MEEFVKVTLEMTKKIANEYFNGKQAEVVARYANAKFKAFEKCKIINTVASEKTGVEKLVATIEKNAERNRKAISGIANALAKNANSLAALSDTQKKIVNNVERIYEGTKALKGIAYLNTGLAVANLAVDIAGFVIISKKLNALSNELNSKMDKVINKDKNDLIAEHKELFMRFGFTAGRIKNGEEVPFKEFEELVTDLSTYISKMESNVIDNVVDTGLGLEIIYTLLPAYSLMFNEYTKAYFMKNNQKPANYEYLYQLYDELLSEEFKQCIEDYYFLERDKTSIEVIDISNLHKLMVINDKIIANDIMQLLMKLGTADKIMEFNEAVEKCVQEAMVS